MPCPASGFPPVEPVKASDAAPAKGSASKAQALRDSMREVLTSWRTWLLALTYFMVGPGLRFNPAVVGGVVGPMRVARTPLCVAGSP